MEKCLWTEEYDYSQTEIHRDSAAAETVQYYPGAMVPPWAPPDETASASRSHSEAEKRRRDRINAQLATLRKLIPMSEKMDKAALLGHVVNHVKEESKRAKEASKISTIPAETDEVIIDHINAEESTSQNNENIYIKASICCEDRPEFFTELNSALKGLGVTIVEAEVTSLGGRMRTNFIVCGKEQSACTTPLKHSLKLALTRLAISSGSSGYSARSKRQRFFYPHLR